MNIPDSSSARKPSRIRRVFRWLFLVAGAVATFITGVALIARPTFPTLAENVFFASIYLFSIVFLVCLLFPIARWIASRLGFFNLIRRLWSWLFCWRTMRRGLIGLAMLATLIAIFYTEENWRGKHAWENCKRELEAKGAVLDWNKLIPSPVPDDQNIFKAPKMTEWFVKSGGLLTSAKPSEEPNPTGLDGLSTNTLTVSVITNETVAADYLKWSDRFQPSFDLIREALKRPYAWMDGDYSQPYQIPVPKFVQARALAQVLAQRAKCCLLLGQPEQALRELTLLNDSRKLLEGAPTGKPMTLVASMINVAITGLYVDTFAYGLQSHAWREPQLIALQEQLKAINLPPFLVESFREEPVYSARCLETTTPAAFAELVYGHPPKNLWQKLTDPNYRLMKFLPRGWVYQNMKFAVSAGQKWNVGFDLTNYLIMPGKVEQGMREVTAAAAYWSPWRIRLENAVPNFTKAILRTARNQTLVNQGQIGCALERYRLARGQYPETLEALVPQFAEKLPHDLIGGQPLHYRRMADGKFLLYSIGWNEKDDGGQVALNKGGREDLENGDWVWRPAN